MSTWTDLRRGSRRDPRVTAVVLVGLAAFVLGVYAVVVVGGGWLAGRSSLPGPALAVLATAVVALGFDPVQTRLEAVAGRRSGGGQPSPFDVLRQFTRTVTGSVRAEDVPTEMAARLGEGTGAAWTEVWLHVGQQLTLAARWPGDEAPAVRDEDPRAAATPGRHWREVRHGFDLLGVLVVQERPHVPLTAVEERLFAGLAAQAGLALRGARLRTELAERARELGLRAEELRRSRQRLVDALDDERRRLERDIHDGAQQHLVALAVNLRLAQTLATTAPDRAVVLMEQQERAARDAVDTLLRLTRGIYPGVLGSQGLVAALEAAADLSPVPVTVTSSQARRVPPRVEAAAYFCCTEALQNAAKHAGASALRVDLRSGEDELVLTVEDDGHGFDVSAGRPGAGLTNMGERVRALDGSLDLESGADGTRLVVRFPLGEGG